MSSVVLSYGILDFFLAICKNAVIWLPSLRTSNPSNIKPLLIVSSKNGNFELTFSVLKVKLKQRYTECLN